MKLLRVKGNSMYPVIRDDDLVLVRETEPELLRRGNIIVYYHDERGEYLIHRLVRKGDDGILYLRGDGYNLSVELTMTSSVIGKAVGFVRQNRFNPLSRPKELLSWSASMLKEHVKLFVRSAFCVRLWGCGK